MVTWSLRKRAWLLITAPVRRWQAKQWHMALREGSPSIVRWSCPQLQAAWRERWWLRQSHQRSSDRNRPADLADYRCATSVITAVDLFVASKSWAIATKRLPSGQMATQEGHVIISRGRARGDNYA